MTKKTRIIAVITAIIVLLAVLSSAAFIAAEADHDCTGEHCPVCQQISICENTLKQLSLAVVALAITAGLGYIYCSLAPIAIRAEGRITLITLKVKLSN